MEFDWDETKNQANIEKHGFDFEDVREVFQGPMLVTQDTRQDYGETRMKGIGLLDAGCVVVIFVEKIENTLRIISLRRASSHERNQFESAFPN